MPKQNEFYCNAKRDMGKADACINFPRRECEASAVVNEKNIFIFVVYKSKFIAAVMILKMYGLPFTRQFIATMRDLKWDFERNYD